MKRSAPSSERAADKLARPDPLVVTEAEIEFFRHHGYLVKPNIVPESVCGHAQDAFESALRRVDPSFSRDPETGEVRCRTPKHTHGIQELGALAHLPCVKDIRLHPNVAAVWHSLLREEDISSSWDRVSYLPSRAARPREKPWPHTDVGPEYWRRKDVGNFASIQSYVQVSRSSVSEPSVLPDPGKDNSPCLVVWEFSHLAHARYFEERGIAKLKRTNWHVYDPETIAAWEKDGKEYLEPAAVERWFSDRSTVPFRRLEIRVPRGGMVFWFSATAHQSTPGHGPALRGSIFERFVIYCCYAPRSLVTKKDAENFRKAIEQRRATSHWPACGHLTLFPRLPHLYSKEAVDEFKAAEAKLMDVQPLHFDAREKQLVPL